MNALIKLFKEQQNNLGKTINTRMVREIGIMLILVLAIYQAGRAIYGSFERQVFLRNQAVALKASHEQAQEVNKELREGLSSYRSSNGIERLARERLNLAGPEEMIVRIGK
ncbi:MAG TPA: septum formation initiator family protein [Candidatus Obscuribacterales bacterium]